MTFDQRHNLRRAHRADPAAVRPQGCRSPAGRPVARRAAVGGDSRTLLVISTSVEREPFDAGPDDALTVVAVDGDIDPDTAPLVRCALARVLAGRMPVCCDLARVTFFGAAAAHTILDANSGAMATGRIFFLRGVQGIAGQVLNAVDPGHIVPR
jgi:anti-anti-sigma regulatory factor